MDERSGSNNDENKRGRRKEGMVAVVHVEFGKMGDQMNYGDTDRLFCERKITGQYKRVKKAQIRAYVHGLWSYE